MVELVDPNVGFKTIAFTEGTAGVMIAVCHKCSHMVDYSKNILTVNHGDKWECPKCGYEIEFRWFGMGWRRSFDYDNKMHKNIDELIK